MGPLGFHGLGASTWFNPALQRIHSLDFERVFSHEKTTVTHGSRLKISFNHI